MQNARLAKLQAGIKIARRNINNLRYTDDSTLMTDSEQELKSLFIRVNKESEKASLNLNIERVNQEKDMGSKSRQRSPRSSNQLIQIRAGSDRDGWMQDRCFKKKEGGQKRGRVCPCVKQKLGGFYKSVKSLKN